MDVGRAGQDSREARFDELYAEAKATLGYGANSLRSITERYREAYRETLSRWHRLRDELDALDRRPIIRRLAHLDGPPAGAGTAEPDGSATEGTDAGDGRAESLASNTTLEARAQGRIDEAASAAEAGAEDARLHVLRIDVERLTGELGRHQSELSKLELSVRSMESTWLFLERGDSSLVGDPAAGGMPTDLQMRIVQAQEAERSRLAQEVHDGPAQALSNAIFQVEYIERMLDQDLRMARTELHFLRDLLRRELGDVRTFISQLRPPLLDELGLEGSIDDAARNMAALTGSTVETDLDAPGDRLAEAEQTAVLRIVQEALQNIRKHAGATKATVSTHTEGNDWILEVADDGRGFDTTTAVARGRRNFGLQFMRERAELIGARFEVRSRPTGGTVVWLAIPIGEESS